MGVHPFKAYPQPRLDTYLVMDELLHTMTLPTCSYTSVTWHRSVVPYEYHAIENDVDDLFLSTRKMTLCVFLKDVADYEYF